MHAAARPPATPARGDGYFAHVDGLRAVAVLAVVLYHLAPSALPGGFLGVDVFFVISGFVVSAASDRLPPLAAGAELLRFYARRARRILPALLACLLATALAACLFIPQSWLSESSDKAGRAAFFGFSNWVLAGIGNDYFSPRAEFNPYTHTWSLGVEEQFYLLFPWLLPCWRRLRWLAALLLVLLGAGSLAWAIHQAGAGQATAAFYQTGARLWQLAAGVLLYQGLVLWRDRQGRSRFDAGLGLPGPLRELLSLLAAGLLAYALLSGRAGHAPWPDGAPAVLASLALLALLHRHPCGPVGRLLGAAPVVALGRMSYSLYLWHWPVLVLMRWTVGLEAPLLQVLALALSLLLAAGSWRWIETPWRRRAIQRPGRVVLAALAAMLLGAGLHAASLKAQPWLSLSTVARHPLDWYAYAKGLRAEYPGCRLANAVETVGGATVRSFWRGQCDLPQVAETRLFVVGDSHALAYNEMLRRHALTAGARVWLYGQGGCALADLQAWRQPACAGALAALEDVAARARPGDVLFLPGLRLPRLAEQDQLFDPQENLRALHAAEAAAGRRARLEESLALLAPLAQRGVRIVVEAPKPLLAAPAYRCSDAFNRGNPVCARGMAVERGFMLAYRAPALEGLQELVARLPGASLWDPFPLLCPGSRCEPLQQGRPLFFDADHLSGHGNRVLLEHFQAHLRGLQGTGADPEPPSAQ